MNVPHNALYQNCTNSSAPQKKWPPELYGLDPDEDQHSVCPDLVPNCLQLKVISRGQKSWLAKKELNSFLFVKA